MFTLHSSGMCLKEVLVSYNGVMQKIGRYSFIRSLAKGGMGEVLLVYDPVCEREIALKHIRSDLKEHKVVRERFLREAKITASLTHPGIITIYTIHQEGDELYYTMPYVAGQTFKVMLKTIPPPSIASLLPIFLSTCQTIAYTHSKNILHRDLKPENILVGKFGEVIILDWGLAQHVKDAQPEDRLPELGEDDKELTIPGKIAGTLAFLAPERILGAPATIQTDIYALGVILYQILTLHLPFTRKSLAEFRKNHRHEELVDPEEAAPYRDVPPLLSQIVKKCLAVNVEKRYQSVEELIRNLLSHMEGRSEWYESLYLDPQKKSDWEFQENLLISRHIALTPATEAADWVNIMVSKTAFPQNLQLKCSVYIDEEGSGVGFLLSVPEAGERSSPIEGFCLWLSAEKEGSSKLFRNTVEVLALPDLKLKRKKWHEILIEKIENNIHFTLDGEKRFTYLSYLPLTGTHVGLLARDANYKLKELTLSFGTQNLQVSCLAIPDAFLAAKEYQKALAEYERIGYSFPGHAEGREALFRAGITMLEKAKNTHPTRSAEPFYTSALEEFSKLHHTPYAPLEYLGKSLVYHALGDRNEEIKCLEFGLRRYHNHPLINVVKEQIGYRMHESAQTDRRSAYKLILITLRQLPDLFKRTDSLQLFSYMIKHWEQLLFLENPIEPSLLGKEKNEREEKENMLNFATPLAFWLAAPITLLELFQEAQTLEPLDESICGNLIYALFELGATESAGKALREIMSKLEGYNLLQSLTLCHKESLFSAIDLLFRSLDKGIGIPEFRAISYLCQYALQNEQENCVHVVAEKILDQPLSRQDLIQLDGYRIWAYLKKREIKQAEKIFDNYSLELLNQETTILHTLYGCYLLLTEGEEISHIHFAGVIETPFPRSWALLSHELVSQISENPAWYNTSFMWERRQLYRQLVLYYECADKPELYSYYRHLERQEYVR